VVFTVLLPFSLGYYMSYLFRAVNAIISPRLVADIGLGAAELGLLTSVYFFVFAICQVPLGLMLDRYGPRRVQSVLLLFAALGAALFAVGDSFAALTVARGCIGLGVSTCLMACFKANVMWWPRDRLPLMNGCATAFGGLGALSATIPVELLVPLIGWRGIFWVLCALTVASAALIFFAVPDAPGERGGPTDTLKAQIAGLGRIFRSAIFWRLAVAASVNTASVMAYQTLWAAPWLRDVARLDSAGVANGLFLFNAGFLAGVFGSGALADAALRRGIPPVWGVIFAIFGTLTVEAMFAANATAIALPLCFAFGCFGSSGILVYALYGRYFPTSLAGRTNSAQNMLSFVMAFVMQWGVGEIVGLWPALAGGGYPAAAHQAGMLATLTATAAAALWLVWPRRGAGRLSAAAGE
jgi:sugar phosphate permease